MLSLTKRPISQVLVSSYFEQPREVAGCSRQYSCLLVSFPKSVFIFLTKEKQEQVSGFPSLTCSGEREPCGFAGGDAGDVTERGWHRVSRGPSWLSQLAAASPGQTPALTPGLEA